MIAPGTDKMGLWRMAAGSEHGASTAAGASKANPVGWGLRGHAKSP